MKISSLEILEKAELPSSQAKAILKVMEMETAATHETLATKADLKADLAELRSELLSKIAQLDAKISGVEGRLARWVLTCILGQTAALAGLGYFLLEHGRR